MDGYRLKKRKGRLTFQLLYHPGNEGFKICLNQYGKVKRIPTVTPSSSFARLRREVARLKAELDSVLEQAERIHLEEAEKDKDYFHHPIWDMVPEFCDGDEVWRFKHPGHNESDA